MQYLYIVPKMSLKKEKCWLWFFQDRCAPGLQTAPTVTAQTVSLSLAKTTLGFEELGVADVVQEDLEPCAVDVVMC